MTLGDSGAEDPICLLQAKAATSERVTLPPSRLSATTALTSTACQQGARF
jgi:hypothetical protein